MGHSTPNQPKLVFKYFLSPVLQVDIDLIDPDGVFQLKAAAGTNAIMADDDGGMYIRNIKEKWFIQKKKKKKKKDTDQLCSNCRTDQHLCFHFFSFNNNVLNF